MKRTILLMGLMALLLLSSVSADISLNDNNIISYYSFDNYERSGTTIIDRAGLNNCTEFNTPTHPSGLINQSVEFDGLTEYTNCDNNIDGESAKTISYWINSDNAYNAGGGTARTPLQINSVSGSTPAALFTVPFGEVTSSCTSERLSIIGGSGDVTCFDGNFKAGQWYHIAWVWDASNSWYQLYINGSKVPSYEGSGGNASLFSVDSIQLGKRLFGGGGLFWDGDLEEVYISNASLTDNDITQLYGNQSVGYTYKNWQGATPPSSPYLYIEASDYYDNSKINGLNVTLSNGDSALTNAGGIAEFLNLSGNWSFNITDPQHRYFDYLSVVDAVENTTTSVNLTGAFVTLSAYNRLGAQITGFSACSGVNCNSTLTNTLKLLLAPNNTNNVEFTSTDYLNNSVLITTIGRDTGSYNLTGLFQGWINVSAIDIYGGAVNVFSINLSGDETRNENTNNGSIDFGLVFGNYTLFFTNENSTIINATIELTNTSYPYVFTALTTNVFNFSFYDEDTLNLINDRTITIELIGDTYSGNFTTNNGTWYASLLTPQVYTIRYDANEYTQRFFVYNLTDKSINEYDLYLLKANISTDVTMTVYDTLGNRLEGAYIKIMRYDVTTNTFSLVDVVTTNFQGEGIADLTLNDEYYKFIIEYAGDVVLTTDPTYVYGTTLNFYVPIGNTGLDVYFSEGAISGLITYNKDTQISSFTWNDADNTASKGCLYGYKPSNGGLTLLNSSCASASSGTVYLPLSNATSTTWFLVGEVTKDSNDFRIDSLRVDFDTVMPENGLGLFLGAVLVIILVFIGFWSLATAVLLGSLVPLLLTITKLANIDYAISIPIFIVGLITGIIIKVKG